MILHWQKEQGIAITSILTSLGLIISTLVLIFTGGGIGGGTPTSARDKDGEKEWIIKYLKSIGEVLVKLTGKATPTLPSILGSIASWLLNLLATTPTWLSQNFWAVNVSIAGLLYVAA